MVYYKGFKKARLRGYQKTTCSQGHSHDSRAEAGYCDELHALLRAGEIQEIKQQKTFDFVVNGKKICGHRVDFMVKTNEGIWEVHEVKGFGTEIWRIKHKLFEALYPEIPYHVIRV